MEIHSLVSPSGEDLILKFINSLPASDAEECRDCIKLFKQYQFALSAKYIKKISKNPKIWELRIKSKSEYRLLFTIKNGTIVFLHGFTKKTRKTPASDLTKAIKRIKYI